MDWYPWCDEAFEKAKKEDKPVFLSIGYSTCHWCHVMEHESFENNEIAKLMNENFVSIKVDREERPDVDQIYMTAVQAMTGGGGWPLSVFLTPEREPFFGGTYFPPDRDRRYGRPGFPDVLKEIARLWREERSRIREWGSQLVTALREGRETAGGEMSAGILEKAYLVFREIYDPIDGGFGGAPKFPRSETLSLLFRIYHRNHEKQALTMSLHTLEKMARGGIYDHLGGGFHRYSTDTRWLVPHFEKMLYDNALLARSYLEAYQIDGNAMWAGIAREILDYVLRDMTSPKGGYYSAEDADSEGVEGKFYVWTEDEICKILNPDEFKSVKDAFQMNILHLKDSVPWTRRYEEPLSTAMKKLFEYRKTRTPPCKDDKILASWNGLMMSAMAVAAQVLEEQKYLVSAKRSAEFILKNLWDGQNLKRRYREGEARFQASLEDYAFVIQGLLDLHETNFDLRWFESAKRLQARADDLFWDDQGGGYFSTDPSDTSLIARMKEIYDGATPSGNSIEAMNLLRFYGFTLDEGYRKKADQIFQAFSGFVTENPQASPALLMAVDFATGDSYVCKGPSCHLK